MVYSPRPNPLFLVVVNGLNRRSRMNSSLMPLPVSAISTTTLGFFPRRETLVFTPSMPLSPIASSAFSIAQLNASRNSNWSPHTSGSWSSYCLMIFVPRTRSGRLSARGLVEDLVEVEPQLDHQSTVVAAQVLRQPPQVAHGIVQQIEGRALEQRILVTLRQVLAQGGQTSGQVLQIVNHQGRARLGRRRPGLRAHDALPETTTVSPSAIRLPASTIT